MDLDGAMGLVDYIVSVLPVSPFRGVADAIIGMPYLGWLNWVVPVGDMLRVMAVWLAAISVYYLYSVLMRWVRVID